MGLGFGTGIWDMECDMELLQLLIFYKETMNLSSETAFKESYSHTTEKFSDAYYLYNRTLSRIPSVCRLHP